MRAGAIAQTLQVCLGEQAIPVGVLRYSRQGSRESTSFVYDDTWLENESRFEISPDLPLTRERYFLTEETGPTGKIEDALRAAPYFHLTVEAALRILGEVHGAVSRWRQMARNASVGMTAAELEAFAAAFEHEEARKAKQSAVSALL